MNKQVPFFNYPHNFITNEDRFIATFKDIGTRGAFIMQKDLSNFECKIASYCGCKYALGVANATDGLQMGLMAGGVKRGDEIIICSHTMIATASSVYFAGAVPVPVEVGKDHLIDPVSIESAITEKAKAILPTQLNGRTADMDAIFRIAEKYNLDVYEDAAQALGSKYKGKNAGTFGKAACVSFYPAKILGCLGDGGIVLTNDEDIYKKLLLLRDHGRDINGDVLMWGLNSRLDNLQAAFLNFQFENYQSIIDRRRKIATIYQDRLEHIEEIVLPPSPNSDSDHYDVYQNYEIEAENRDELKKFLSNRGVGTIIQWGGKAVHHFTQLGFKCSLPYTDLLFKKLLLIPLNLSLTDNDVHYVCDCIIDFYRQ